ncbi:unnamed protein product [Prunus armeniaca]|uniref:F-box associated beta-propeller type 3 domain-containing protein n=1 Tax=Prunus armeniaca TaxID=36596 RepID=A0A6J5V8L6_PRUAR|nr:unnamed protein product [Prunus armeniaca]
MSVEHHMLELVGHCDGIICLRHQIDVDQPYIPPLPYVPETPQNLALGLPKTSETLGAGFGYDDKAKVHKVVRVKFVLAVPDLNLIYSRAEVYNLDADSWREIECHTQEAHIFPHVFLTYLNGIFYWYGSDTRTSLEVIVSFDMADEKFHKITVPDSFDDLERQQA